MPLSNNSQRKLQPQQPQTQITTVPKSAPITTTTRSWQRRFNAAQQAGIPTKYVAQVARDDLKRVAQGRSPLTSTEAGIAVRARMTGNTNPLGTDESGDTGFFGDVLSDVRDIGQGLNPIKLIPAVAGDFYSAATHPGQTAEGLANVATGIAQGGPFTKAGTKDLNEALATPLVNWIPGLYTAATFGREGVKGLLEHPVMTGLDVLPYAKGVTSLAARSIFDAAMLDDIATRGAAEQISRVKTLRPDVVDALPEDLRAKLNNTLTPLSPREKMINAAAEGKPASTLARLIAPGAMDMADAGSLAFRTRMGMGPAVRYMSRQHSILERGMHAAAKEQENVWLNAMKDLTDEEAQQVMRAANFNHINDVYEPHIDTAVKATRDFQDWMAKQSSQFPEMELTRVPLESGRSAYYAATGKEGEVARAYKAAVAADDAHAAEYANWLEMRQQTIDQYRAEAEARVAKLEEIHARQVAGRAAKSAPGRPFTGIAPLNNVFPALSERLRAFVTDSRSSISRRNLSISSLSDVLTRYQAILDQLDANPGLTTRQVLDLAKKTLPKEELPTFAKFLEENGISHVGLKTGREVDVWKQLGVRKPGALRANKPNPTAAARTLDALEQAKQELADDSWVTKDIGSPEQRAAAKRLRAFDRKRQSALNKRWDTQQEFLAKRAETPPSSFKPMLEEKIKEASMNRARGKAVYQALGGGDVKALWNLPEGISRYLATLDEADLSLVEPEYQQIVKDVFSTWEELDRAGYDPIWVHKVSPANVNKELTPRLRGMANRKPGQLKERSGQPTASVNDIKIAMKASGREFLEKLWHRQYVDDVILPYAKSADEVKSEVLPLVEIGIKKGSTKTRDQLYNEILNEHYKTYEPDGSFMGVSSPKIQRYQQERGTLYLHKDVLNTADKLLNPKRPSALGRASGKATSIFKTSVLSLSPKHMVNQAFADTMWLLGRGGKEEFSISRWIEAFKTVRRGEMPIELSNHIDPLSADQMWDAAVGNKFARIFRDGNGDPRKLFTVMFKLEEAVTNTQRMVAFESELARGARAGLDAEAARRGALEHVYKTILDIDSLTPFERTIAKQVFPFYAFMRYLYNYVLTYPSDHPVRAAIVASIARQEKADQDSGLPGMWSDYFFLGQPNDNGDITAIDVRSLNPVRDLSNMFTFAGFVQQMNPLIGGGLQIMGVNEFSASPELYPNLKYDPVSGRMVTTHKGFFDSVLTMAQSVIPQVELADYYLGLTEEMRQLKATNKDAYQRVLYRNLFLPFTKRTVNIGAEKQKVALSRYQEAQNAVSDSLTYGKALPSKFKTVPYQGKMVPRSFIEEMLNARKQRPEGAAPKATLGTGR